MYLHEDAYGLLASFLDSEVTAEVFTVMEILSGYAGCRPKIAESGALTSVLRALDSQAGDFKEQALNILCNLSSEDDICSHIASSECIPKLVPLLCHNTFTRKCLLVMKYLRCTKEAAAAVAETDGCLASIAEVLEFGSFEEQEHAIDILFSLCSQSTKYCQLVMGEGVIPSLVCITVNGSGKGKASALELLRLMRDLTRDVEYEPESIDHDAARGSSNHASEKKSSKRSRFFSKMPVFWNRSSKKRCNLCSDLVLDEGVY